MFLGLCIADELSFALRKALDLDGDPDIGLAMDPEGLADVRSGWFVLAQC